MPHGPSTSTRPSRSDRSGPGWSRCTTGASSPPATRAPTASANLPSWAFRNLHHGRPGRPPPRAGRGEHPPSPPSWPRSGTRVSHGTRSLSTDNRLTPSRTARRPPPRPLADLGSAARASRQRRTSEWDRPIRRALVQQRLHWGSQSPAPTGIPAGLGASTSPSCRALVLLLWLEVVHLTPRARGQIAHWWSRSSVSSTSPTTSAPPRGSPRRGIVATIPPRSPTPRKICRPL